MMTVDDTRLSDEALKHCRFPGHLSSDSLTPKLTCRRKLERGTSGGWRRSGLVSGLVSSMSLPWFPPVGHSTRRRLPSRGSLGPRFPTFPGTMRRYDCHPAPLGVLRVSLVPRYRAGSRRAWSPSRAPRLVEAPRRRQGLGSPGPPLRAWRLETGGAPTFPSSPSADMPRSQTPVVSYALAIAHPGLLPSSACTPSASPQLYPFRGSMTRPAFSLHPAPYGPLLGGTRVRY